MIDNYDSFTYNLVQYFGELNQKVKVHRNDSINISQIKKIKPKYIVISPGPCTPNEAGMSISIIKYFAGKIPIFGVCLGFQAIAQAFGGKIIQAKEIMHGKISTIYHDNYGIFKDVKNPLKATRYHSLVVEQKSLPDCFIVTAKTKKQNKVDEIMGIRHNSLMIEGVQFHPESILTDCGKQMLSNFLQHYK